MGFQVASMGKVEHSMGEGMTKDQNRLNFPKQLPKQQVSDGCLVVA